MRRFSYFCKMLAPIALFVFNRPVHTRETITALKNNFLAHESDLIIFSDGPRSNLNFEKVEEVRKYLRTITGFKSVTIIESQNNIGLANSIINGVTKVLNQYECVIVLEDDMLTSPYFLSYMNQGLNLYEKDEQVISIHGYFFPVVEELSETFFIKGADCWGWATWRRGWALFEVNPWLLLVKIISNGLVKEFDLDYSYGYTRMLFSQCIGRVDSWAIRWYASAFLKNRLTLYPAKSLVKNIGLDNSGMHTKQWDKKAYDTTVNPSELILSKIEIKESREGRLARANYFRKTRIPLRKKIFYRFDYMIKWVINKK